MVDIFGCTMIKTCLVIKVDDTLHRSKEGMNHPGGGVLVYVKFGIAVEIENDEIETKTEIWTSFSLLK